jgi:hypothetical protein
MFDVFQKTRIVDTTLKNWFQETSEGHSLSAACCLTVAVRRIRALRHDGV